MKDENTVITTQLAIRPRLGRRLLQCLVVVVSLLVGYVILAVLVEALIPGAIASTIVLDVALLGVVLLVRHRAGQRFTYLPRPNTGLRSWRLIGVLALCTVLMFAAGQEVAVWLYQIIGSSGFDQVNTTQEHTNFIMVLVFSLVCAPAAEEAVWRGVLYPLLRQRVGMTASVIISSAVFAGLHGNLNQICVATPLGVLLALLYERTRSFWPGVIIHVTNNAAAAFVPAAALATLALPGLVMALAVACALTLLQFGQRVAPFRQPLGKLDTLQCADKSRRARS